MYRLEEETEADWWEVEALYDLCFAPGRTALSSYRLRDGVAKVAELCLTLRDGEGILAAVIRYWPVRVAGRAVLLLGPVAVHPTRQGEGLGGLLIHESLAEAARLGWERVLLVGDAPYYRRFGFKKIEGVEMPPPTNPDRILATSLRPGAWTGFAGRWKKIAKVPPDSGLKHGAVAHIFEAMMDEPDRADTDHGPLPAAALIEIAALARRAKNANGPLIRAFNKLGGGVETQLTALPPKVRGFIDSGTEGLLSGAYRAAGAVGALKAVPETGDWAHRLAAATGGALGGFGGLATAAVELPATVALFFGAMQKIATEYGYDPKSDKARLICLEVFGTGGPFANDDGVNTGFIGSRLAVNSGAVQAVIRRVAPAVAALLGRKLASQAVPVIGAAAGAGLNIAFLGYFREMAHVRFGLERLADTYSAEAVEAQFRAEANSIGLD